ncbi:MAG TPA: hypothetical protein VIE88_06540, partial [Vicinamibacteria bacterium]
CRCHQRRLKGFDRLLAVDRTLENVLTLRVTLPWERYEGKMVSFYDRWLQEVEGIPGVRASGLTTQFPPMAFMQSRLAIEHRAAGAGAWARSSGSRALSRSRGSSREFCFR